MEKFEKEEIKKQPYRIEGVDPPGKYRIEVQYPTCRMVKYYTEEEISAFERVFGNNEE